MLSPYGSTDILGAIIDAMPDFVFWKDLDGVFRGCNRALATVCFGRSREEVIGRSDFDLIADREMAAAFREDDFSVMAGATPLRRDIRFTVADGSRRRLDTQKIPLVGADGTVYGLLVMARDTTVALGLSEALYSSESRYRDLFDHMSEAFALHEIICDGHGVPCDYRFLEINRAFERLTGLSRRAVVGRTLWEVLPDEDPHWVEAYGRVALTGVAERFTRHSSSIGRHYSVHAFSPAPGQFAVLFMDSTEQIVSEQALRVSKGRLLDAQRMAKLGSWELDHATGELHWSDEIHRIFEIDPALFPTRYEGLIRNIHREDQARVQEVFRQSLKSHSPYSVTYRLWLSEDRIKYVHEQCETSFDADGAPVRSICTIQDITERKVLQENLERMAMEERELHSFHTIVTNNPVMKRVLELAAHVSRARNTTVAIFGESGTGKEVLARAIHASGSDLPGKFVAVNCAAIPDNLLESELFGHVRGAFTGADFDRDGKFCAARGGTILLDEIGDMPLHLQSKLLRVLEERVFEKVGGNAPLRADCRIIVSTNRDLSQLVREGRFRDDLFHRVNVFPLWLPPLRERIEDMPLLCDKLLDILRHQLGLPLACISPQAMQQLLGYRWPGNVRELRNCLERAAIIADGGMIRAEHLVLGTVAPVPETACGPGDAVSYNLSLPAAQLSLDALIERIVAITLERCDGNKARVARLLKIGRSTFYRTRVSP